MKPAPMLEDERPIRMVNDDVGGQNLFVVGRDGVTAIACYGEPGPHCFIPWLAIYKGDVIVARMAARDVTLYYAETLAEGVDR